MMAEWKQTTLSEIAEIVMGQSPAGETCNQNGIGAPLLNGPTEFGSSFPAAVQFTTDGRKMCDPNDLLFCVRGSTTGRMNWADQGYAIGRGLAAIRHKNGAQYKQYLKGVIDFNLPDLLAAATGSTFPNVSRDQILGMKVSVPPLKIQKSIAEVLSAFDNKIELNHQMSATLEATARALFKSWFVDFDPVRAKMEGRAPDGLSADIAALFPDTLVDSSLGEIPTGWEVGNIGVLAANKKKTLRPENITNDTALHWSICRKEA